jgi:hypothetical protein
MIPREIGPYRLTEQLGAGGLGKVFRAEDAEGRAVAIKVLTNLNERSLARFRRELELGRTLEHPNLVRTFEGGEVQGHPYLVLELIPGEDLAQSLRAQGPLGAKDLLDMARQLAAGLEYLHARGLVHRDLKPENLRVRPDGQLKILDLGLMHDPDTTAITATGTVLGTFLYMSPEQLRGGEKTPSMDLYAMAVILYKLSTGRHPLYGEGSIKLSDYLPLPGLGEVLPWRPGATTALDGFFRKGLAPDVEDRWETPQALVDGFAAALVADGLVERPGAHTPTGDTLPLPVETSDVASASIATRPRPPVGTPARSGKGVAAALVAGLLAGGAWLAWPVAPPEVRVVEGLALSPDHHLLVLDTDRSATLHLEPGGPALPRDASGLRHFAPVASDQDDLRLFTEVGEPLPPWSLSAQAWEPLAWNVDGSLSWGGETLPLWRDAGGSPWKRALPTPVEMLQQLTRGMLELDLPTWIFETQETGRRPGRLGEVLRKRGLATLQVNTANLLPARLGAVETLPVDDIELWYLAHDLCLAEAYLRRAGAPSPIDPLERGLYARLIRAKEYDLDRQLRPPERVGRQTFPITEDFFMAKVPQTEERDAFEQIWFVPQEPVPLALPPGAGDVSFEAVITRATVFAHDYFGLVSIEGTRPVYFYEDPTGPGGQVERELATQEAPQLRRAFHVPVPQSLLQDGAMALEVTFQPWSWDGKHGVEHVVMQAYGWTRDPTAP